MKGKKRKQSVTLIEIMIVILLIGLIGGALAFNMRGSIDKGRVFKSEQNIARVYDALMMEYAKGEYNLDDIVEKRETILEHCPFIKEGKKVLKDAWGENLVVTINKKTDEVAIMSSRVEKWKKKHAYK